MSHSNRKLFTTNQLDNLEAHAFNIIQARNWVNVMIQEYQQSLGNVLNTVFGTDQKDSSIQVQNSSKEDPSTDNDPVLPSEVFNTPNDLLSTVNDAPSSNQIFNPPNECLSTVNDAALSSEVFSPPNKLLSSVNDAPSSNHIFNPPSAFLSTFKDAALYCKAFKPPKELLSTVNDALLSNPFINSLEEFLSTVNDAVFPCETFSAANEFLSSVNDVALSNQMFNSSNKLLSTVNNAALSSENMAVNKTSALKIDYPSKHNAFKNKIGKSSKEIKKPKICSSKSVTIEPLRQSSDIHIYVPIDYSIAKPKEQNNSINCTIRPYKNQALGFCDQRGESSLGIEEADNPQQREKKLSNFNENMNLDNKEKTVKQNLFASAGAINGLENSWDVLAYNNIFPESRVQDYEGDTESDSSEEDQYYSRIVEQSRKRRKRRNKKNGAKRRR